MNLSAPGGGLLRQRDTGVSGGERKRASVGVDLIGGPSLMFLDEPTSGLDSFLALSVAEQLRNLADSGRTVVTTIHQPRSLVFQMFSRYCFACC